MNVEASSYKLVGGVLCLDFTNTQNWSSAEQPYDFFGSYLSLLQWGLQLEVFTQPQAEHLHLVATRHALQAQAVVENASRLRQSIYRIFSATSEGAEAPAEDLAFLNDALSGALSHLQVGSDQEKYVWMWTDLDLVLDSLLWKVAQSAGDLLTSEQLGRVRRCDGCGWLFLDTTRGGRRRWCDMRLCGNRAKARRHYARGKAES